MPEPDNLPLEGDAQRRAAVWRLFREGVLDEDAATAHLLALDLESRREAPARLEDWIRLATPESSRRSVNGSLDRTRSDAA